MITYLVVTGNSQQFRNYVSGILGIKYRNLYGSTFSTHKEKFVHVYRPEHLLGYHAPNIIERVKNMLLDEEISGIQIIEWGEYQKSPVYNTQEYKRLKRELELCEK